MREEPSAPFCPNCGKPMRLSRIVPRVAAHPELRSFECRDCREAVTQAVSDLGATGSAS